MNHIELQVAEPSGETAEAVEEAVEQVVAEAGDTEDEEITQEMTEVLAEEEADPEDGEAKLPGVDKVLAEASEKLGPEYAEVIKGLQREMVQGNEIDSLRSQLQARIDEVEQALGDVQGEGTGETEEDPLDAIPEDQMDLLRLVLEREGYVKRSDQEAEDASEFAESLHQKGVEEWGEDFGQIVDGEFIPSDEAKAAMEPVFSRLVEQQNLTMFDLHVLANYDSLIEQAKTAGAEAERTRIREASQNRVSGLQRANGVAVRPAGGDTSQPIYKPDDVKGKTMTGKISEVLANARKQVTS